LKWRRAASCHLASIKLAFNAVVGGFSQKEHDIIIKQPVDYKNYQKAQNCNF
jgi:hypothetical protein